MKHERYIINEQEIELLDKYEGIMAQRKDPCRYGTFGKDDLARFCMMKDRANDLYLRKYQAAREVIDLIAKHVNIDPEGTGFWGYAPDKEGSTPILDRIKEWLSRSGEKTQLKRRLQELEQENALLRSLLQKQGGGRGNIEGAWIKVKSRTKQLDITKKVKDAVWARDGGSCILCGSRESMPNAHYIPRSHGGLGIEENVVTLCCQCHYDYGHTVRRGEIRERIRGYLKEIYPCWSENELYFKKYGIYRI